MRRLQLKLASISLIFGSGVAFLLFLIVPEKPIAVAELVGNDHVVSSDGLARLLRVNPADSVEMQAVTQLLTSRSAAEYAIGETPGLDADTVVKNITVKNDAGGLKLLVSADSEELAVRLAQGLLTYARTTAAEIRAAQSASLLKSVDDKRVSDLKSFQAINSEISDALKKKNILITSDGEREQILAFLLSQLEAQISELTVREIELRNRLGGGVSDGTETKAEGDLVFRQEFEDIGESQALSQTRRRLIEQETELATLRSRYGASNHQVINAEAGLRVLKENLQDLMNAQREMIGVSIDSSTHSIETLREKVVETLRSFREMDVSYDPEIVTLQMRLEAMGQIHADLEARAAELAVFRTAEAPGFFVITQPYIAESLRYKRFLALALIGLAVAGVAFFLMMQLRAMFNSVSSGDGLGADRDD